MTNVIGKPSSLRMIGIRHSVKRLSSLFRSLRKKKINILPVVAAVVWIIFLGLFCPSFGYFLYILFSDKSDLYVKAAILLLDVETKNEALKFLGISMGGLLVGLQAFISYRRAKAMEDTVENTEKGMRQERLKNAIEHLGQTSDSVRLGGAYELFHLAHDTKELRQTVLDILCAHIRQTTSDKEYQEDHKSKPSEEIQSLLTLLFVQDHDVFKGLRINLQGSWLNGTELSEARLEEVVFTGAHLQKTNLNSARLQGAKLDRARLHGILLNQSRLQEADLFRALLHGANLFDARLQNTKLYKARLHGADLNFAKMQGADLSEAQLQGSALSEAQLHGANLFKTKLHGVTSQSDGSSSFETRMRDRIGEQSDLLGVTFEGGINKEELGFIIEGLSDNAAKGLRAKLNPHVGKQASHKLSDDRGAVTGTYTEKEAEQWIAEYEKSVSENSEEDNS